MGVLKNIQFTELIKAQGHLKEFNFWKKPADKEVIYDVDVTDEKGNRHYFSMEPDGKNWMIREAEVPTWIKEVLALLQSAIEANT
jgi:hypothetical protein